MWPKTGGRDALETRPLSFPHSNVHSSLVPRPSSLSSSNWYKLMSLPIMIWLSCSGERCALQSVVASGLDGLLAHCSTTCCGGGRGGRGMEGGRDGREGGMGGREGCTYKYGTKFLVHLQ